MSVVLDGVPGNPDDPTGTSVHLSREDGALLAMEVDVAGGNDRGGLPNEMWFAVGGYLYTRDFECILPPPGMDPDFDHGSSRGIYALAEGGVYAEPGSESQGVDLFLRVGVAEETVNQLSHYPGGGAVYTRVLRGRNEDLLGLAVAAAFNGDHYRRLAALDGTPVDGAEVAIEPTYFAELRSGFSF